MDSERVDKDFQTRVPRGSPGGISSGVSSRGPGRSISDSLRLNHCEMGPPDLHAGQVFLVEQTGRLSVN